MILSKFFVVKITKNFDIFIFHSREKLGLEGGENGLEKQKSRLYFSKT